MNTSSASRPTRHLPNLRTRTAAALTAAAITLAGPIAAGTASAVTRPSTATEQTVLAASANSPTSTEPATRVSTASGTFDDYLRWAADSSAQMWLTSLQAAGYTWQSVGVSIVDGTDIAVSGCGGELVGDTIKYSGPVSPAFYCRIDNTIYLSSAWIARLTPDNFGAAFAVSHEMVHAVQHMMDNDAIIGAAVQPWELQADCLSGAWFRYEASSLASATRASAMAGSLGDSLTDPAQHHGTPTERAAAFMAGYNGGGSACPLNVGA